MPSYIAGVCKTMTLTQTVSKINRKIKQAVTDTLAKPHQIAGPRGGVRKINALSL